MADPIHDAAQAPDAAALAAKMREQARLMDETPATGAASAVMGDVAEWLRDAAFSVQALAARAQPANDAPAKPLAYAKYRDRFWGNVRLDVDEDDGAENLHIDGVYAVYRRTDGPRTMGENIRFKHDIAECPWRESCPDCVIPDEGDADGDDGPLTITVRATDQPSEDQRRRLVQISKDHAATWWDLPDHAHWRLFAADPGLPVGQTYEAPNGDLYRWRWADQPTEVAGDGQP